ncbi:entericidin EcnA/B family protein [Rhodovulum strictum]|uniref:Entericidin EcnA/B family protein n=1 Tax=Rhodovulum strictum TaxID=58314 RepID=A0A844B1U6_9RHOB|nr:entericidin EcnA/B family protein [Rhodovulum strictum]MRH20091.1 entericidin EcnA/B family protein [Rhodovulum strictum]
MTRTFLMLSLLALAGCGTVEGIGEDISAGARAVRNVF